MSDQPDLMKALEESLSVVPKREPVTTYVTFGFDHSHILEIGHFNRSTVAKITAVDPRAVAFELFGRTWCTDYPGEMGEAEVAKWGYHVIEVPAEKVAEIEAEIAGRSA